ncbi:MAG: MaoC family dehydratase N-terminal domain-containing protein [Myxococcota bacterium]|nr:MaoC family dehydratase N-terminal domain-containing protein [Myxococcota bacterium]
MAVSTVLSKMIGKSSEPIEVDVERGHIQRFARAIGETNPIHFDPKAAAAAGYSDIVATLTFASAIHDFEAFYDQLGINPHVMMHQEEEFEYFRPIVAGDTLKVSHSVTNAYQKDVPNGQLVFIVLETRGNDKRSRPVFKSRRVLVELRK